MNRVDMAFQNVDRDFFVLREDGKIITQSTASEAIKNGLEMLDVREGNHVLEIGTGSGFSAALLTYLVGLEGSVVSLDIEPELTKRAKELFKQKEINNVSFETRDGRKGFESEKPYDRIVAWTTPESLPDSWKNQIGENGIIVAPFQVLPIARCTVTVRLRNENGILVGESVGKEGYIMMSSGPVEDTRSFDEKIHAGLAGEGDNPVWASAIWMMGIKNKEWCNKFHDAQPQSSPFPENGKDIRAYLLGTNPDGFTFAFHPDHGYWVGYSSPDGFAMVADHSHQQWIFTDKKHADVLSSWWDEWKSLGKPSYEQLQPFMVGDQVKVKVKGGV